MKRFEAGEREWCLLRQNQSPKIAKWDREERSLSVLRPNQSPGTKSIHIHTHTCLEEGGQISLLRSPSEHEASCLNRFSREEGVFIIDKWDGYDQKNLEEERNLYTHVLKI